MLDRVIAMDHFSERDSATAMVDVLHAVQYLHEIGLVHRDLKARFEFCRDLPCFFHNLYSAEMWLKFHFLSVGITLILPLVMAAGESSVRVKRPFIPRLPHYQGAPRVTFSPAG